MKKKKGPGLGTVIILGFLIYFAYVAVDQQHIFHAKESEMKKVQDKVAEEKKTNEELKKQKDMLNSDEYYEKVAREKLGMVKPGERVYIDAGN